jgi:putative sigma-54 modulation protein
VEITISSRHVKVSPRLEDVVREKIGRLGRYQGMDHAEVHFSEEKNPRIADKEVCEVTLEGHGHHVRAKVSAPDPYTAVDLAYEKLEHQLHKLKTRIVRHKTGRDAAKKNGNGAGAVVPLPEPAMEVDDNVAKIVKTKSFAMVPMTAEDAVLQMDLVGHDFYFFTNAETGRAAVVYLREDGNVGLIDEAGPDGE